MRGMMYTSTVTGKDVTGIGVPSLEGAQPPKSLCGFFIG